MSSLALARTALACLALISAWSGSAAAVEEGAGEAPVEYVDDEVYEDDEEPAEYVDDEVYEDDEEPAEYVDDEVYEDDEEPAEDEGGEASRETQAETVDEEIDEGLRSIDSYGEVELDEAVLSPIVRAQRGEVEDLYVTATKRAESVQDVPISMAALSATFLDDAGITGFGQIAEYVPNLTINPVTDTRGTVIRIRGIGSVGTNAGIDPSVGVFIDGVYQGRAGMSVGDLLDVERVEVLRGPQGTLYGKNTAAGLINVISKRPTYDYEATLESLFGNYNNYEGRGSINIPIVDEHIATRLSAYGVTRDGFDKRLNVGGRTTLPSGMHDYANDDPYVFRDGRVNNANKWGFKSRTVFDITDSLSFLLTGDYSYENTKCCIADIITYEGYPTLISSLTFQALEEPVNPSVPALGGTGIPLAVADPFDRLVTADAEPKNKVKIGGIALDGTYEFPEMPLIGGSTLNFIGSWRTYSSDSQFDGDFSYYDAVIAWTQVELDQYSAELRFASPGGELIDYQVGFYFFHSDMHTLDRNGFQSDFVLRFPAAPANTQNIGDNVHKTYSYAGFAQATITPIEQISATGGVRVSYEEKTRVGSQFSNFPACDPAQNPRFPRGCLDTPPIIGPPSYADQERAITNVSGMATLRYFPTEDVMLYGSFATGFKSGGFNQLRTKVGVPGEFEDEESMNVEGGVKTSFFDRMITFNATGFYTEYDEFQAQTFDGSSINVINAGQLTSWGIEADLVVVPLPNLIIGSSVGFNIAKYTSFDLGEATSEQKWFGTVNPNVPVPPGTEPVGNPLLCNSDLANLPAFVDPSACVQDLAGKRLDSAPDWSLSMFAQYDYLLPWFPIELFLRAEYALTTTRYLATDLDRNLKQNTSHVVNLRAGFRSESKLWEITGWVRNLTDEGYNVVGFDVPTINGYAGVNAPPRQYGITLRLDFTDFTGLPGLFGF
jgi:iron complex outermembrane receptor protein